MLIPEDFSIIERHVPQQHEVNIITRISDAAMKNAGSQVRTEVLYQLTKTITAELHDVVYEHVKANIDWKRITTEVENEIIRRMAGTITERQ